MPFAPQKEGTERDTKLDNDPTDTKRTVKNVCASSNLPHLHGFLVHLIWYVLTRTITKN